MPGRQRRSSLLIALAFVLACGRADSPDTRQPTIPRPAPQLSTAPPQPIATPDIDATALYGSDEGTHIVNADIQVSAEAREFGRLIERLSEPGGYFPSDNLVSNETSYLHVLGKMRQLGVRGGAYVGVGPDQNFSYIAQIRPSIAFIIDIRRDNLLHHLLFKALFENAHNRLEYLCLMLGKPLPEKVREWDNASIDEIVVYVDTTGATPEVFEKDDAALLESVKRFGFPLSEADLGTISGIHALFYDYGLDIRYSNRGRGPYGRFPSWRLLILETDLDGVRRGYLASEQSFRAVKDLEHRNLIVPVVGDLAGPHALAAIGREVATRKLRISAFYVSNVEQYLMQGPGFDAFARTVEHLPFDDRSVIIRSYFARRYPIPQTVPGHFSTQLLEHFTDFVHERSQGGYRSYIDLVTRNAIPLN
jgi:hypothetical protein